MPDCHLGIGATVGSVIAMRGAVSPAAVGVDIGCGVAAVRTDLVKEDLEALGTLRSAIESAIPVGFAAHEEALSSRELTRLGARRARGVLGGLLRPARVGADAGEEGSQAAGYDGRRQSLRGAVRGPPRRPRMDHPALGLAQHR
ncbi:RtcB family protein [Brachybacterium alimentarium]|uniref:RtcB family protein n=1 Tax=Brachybacterium alimentarium TaxID=47845 RepID=UPI003FD05BEE